MGTNLLFSSLIVTREMGVKNDFQRKKGSSQSKFQAGWWLKDQSIVVVLVHPHDHIK